MAKRPASRREPGVGFTIPRDNFVRIVVAFEAPTFQEIRDRAVAEDTSFAQQVRSLMEFALENIGKDD